MIYLVVVSKVCTFAPAFGKEACSLGCFDKLDTFSKKSSLEIWQICRFLLIFASAFPKKGA